MEIHFVGGDFDEHERAVGVEAFVGDGCFIQIIGTQFAGRAFRKIINSMLWMDALVNVFMAGENYVDAIFDEERLKDLADVSGRAVETAGRI